MFTSVGVEVSQSRHRGMEPGGVGELQDLVLRDGDVPAGVHEGGILVEGNHRVEPVVSAVELDEHEDRSRGAAAIRPSRTFNTRRPDVKPPKEQEDGDGTNSYERSSHGILVSWYSGIASITKAVRAVSW
jgi:hypothetical protein